jgi:hypothetical protein
MNFYYNILQSTAIGLLLQIQHIATNEGFLHVLMWEEPMEKNERTMMTYMEA